MISATAGIALSKLATDPLARANHTGTQLSSTISDFNAAVQGNSISDLSPITADLNLQNFKITNLSPGTLAADAVNLSQMQQAIDLANKGVRIKEPVEVYAESNITLSGLQTIDGYALNPNDSVLVNGQTPNTQNGVYLASSGAWTRRTDFDESSEQLQGSLFYVLQGTNHIYKQFVLTTQDPIVIGTTPINFQLASNGNPIIGGTGITVTGQQVAISTAYAGQTSISTLGTITTGVWNGTDIAIADGGTGASTASQARSNLGAGDITVQETTFGDGVATSFVIPNTLTIGGALVKPKMIQITKVSNGEPVFINTTVNATTPFNVNISSFTPYIPASNEFKITLIG
jgi:hypothetical protein